jgi:hypothetical protein
MVAKIPLTGKQLSTMNLRPDICRTAGAQIMGKELVGGEAQLKSVKASLQQWMKDSGEITLQMDLQPIVDQIDEALK